MPKPNPNPNLSKTIPKPNPNPNPNLTNNNNAVPVAWSDFYKPRLVEEQKAQKLTIPLPEVEQNGTSFFHIFRMSPS